jgi:Ribose/Galactose Isomerase
MSSIAMIFTARQLQDLHKTNGHVRLPVGARVTPLGSDWLRSKSIGVMYGEDPVPERAGLAEPPASAGGNSRASAPATPGTILWWCDGPCGQAKAALAAQARESNLQPSPVPPEAKYLVGAIKHLAGEIRNDHAAAGIMLVQTGAAAVVYANRCPSLRAILGTCRDAVQQGVDVVGANVLVIEHPYQTLPQVRNLLSQFLRMRRDVSDDVKRQMKELATCG